jgi:hypothetical protein
MKPERGNLAMHGKSIKISKKYSFQRYEFGKIKIWLNLTKAKV